MISTIGQVRFGSIAVCLSKLEPPHFNWKFVMIWIGWQNVEVVKRPLNDFILVQLQVINIKANQAFHRLNADLVVNVV